MGGVHQGLVDRQFWGSIGLVTHSDFLFSELLQPLTVNADTVGTRRGRSLILKDVTHVVKQSAHG